MSVDKDLIMVGYWSYLASYLQSQVKIKCSSYALATRCAEAVERSEFGHANELINELRQHSSAYGNGSQRTAYYFMEALVGFLSFSGYFLGL